MLNMGIPLGAVRQALQKGGKDPNIVDMDPKKSYASQMEEQDSGDEKDAGPPLKDDPQYTKFFKVRLLSVAWYLHSECYYSYYAPAPLP